MKYCVLYSIIHARQLCPVFCALFKTMHCMPGDVDNDTSLPDGLLHCIAKQDELLVIKNARISNMMCNNALTVGDYELYDYWESMLSFGWEMNEWYDNLTTFTDIIDKNFTILSDF